MSTSHLTKVFVKGEKPALDDITLSLEKGKITGLVGPDGAGKTTLIRFLAHLLKPTSGSVDSPGFDEIGYMPQKFGLYEDLTVQQNLDLYADLQGIPKEERDQTLERLLQFTTLKPFTDRLAGNLSGGMKQKLGLACTLIRKPKLLLLDEPSVGVDPISRRELWKMVKDLLKEDVTVLWSTSYMDEAEKCDNVILLNEGKVLYQGTTLDLVKRKKENTKFEDLFIELLGGIHLGPSLLAEKMPVIPKITEDVIVADKLTKKFGNFVAADAISFTIKSGEIFGLLGPNGAGKSTTFKMLCGLLTPTSGRSSVYGSDMQEAKEAAKQKIGYMAQKFSLYGSLSVLQNLQFFAGIYKSKGVDLMIEIFSLKPYLNVTADTLPLGYKQRLALACACMHNPPVLFLDEPTSGVDPISRREFWNHIKGVVKKGVTVVVTTHFMDEAENCDRIALIYRGKIIEMGTPAELKKRAGEGATLEDAFIRLIDAQNTSPR